MARADAPTPMMAQYKRLKEEVGVKRTTNEWIDRLSPKAAAVDAGSGEAHLSSSGNGASAAKNDSTNGSTESLQSHQSSSHNPASRWAIQ